MSHSTATSYSINDRYWEYRNHVVRSSGSSHCVVCGLLLVLPLHPLVLNNSTPDLPRVGHREWLRTVGLHAHAKSDGFDTAECPRGGWKV